MANFGQLNRIALAVLTLAAVGTAHAGRLLVGDYGANRVVIVDDVSGNVIRTAAIGGGLNKPLGVACGPDGYLYVASYGSNQILRYNDSGGFVDVFVNTPKPHGITFMDDDLIVSNHSNGTVSRFGQISWVSVPTGRFYHSVVVRNGRLFASFQSGLGGGIQEFNPMTGAPMGDLVPVSAGLVDVQGFTWSYDGTLYATSSNANRFYKFNGETGAPLGSMAVTGGQPLVLRMSSSGELVSSAWQSTKVVRHSPWRQNYVGDLVRSTAGLVQPWYLDRLNPTIEAKGQFQGWMGANFPSGNVYVEFRKKGSPLSLVSTITKLDSRGVFKAQSPAYLSEYDMQVKVGTFLSRVVTVDTRDASTCFPTINFFNGDVDGNNVVDSDDYKLLSEFFGSTAGDSNYRASADLDGDGTIGPNDFSLLTTNFGLTGEK